MCKTPAWIAVRVGVASVRERLQGSCALGEFEALRISARATACALLAGFESFFEGSVRTGISSAQNGRDATPLCTA